MIIVVVGKEDTIQRRQVRQTGGRWMKSLGAGKAERGSPLPENWVGEHAKSVKFQKDGRVPQPGDSKTAIDPALPSSPRVL
jgi:hypothetical protein